MIAFFNSLNIALACAILLLSIGVIVYNIYANYHEKKIQVVRAQLNDLLLKYLNGGKVEKSLEALINAHTDLLIGVIAQLIEKDETPQERLIQFLESHHLKYFRNNEIENLKSGDWYKRQFAANYLPFIAPKALIIEPLIEALQDHVFEVRFAAACSLARLKAIEAVPAILEQQNTTTQLPFNEASEILSGMGKTAIDPMIQYSASSHASDAAKILAINALRKHKPSQAKELILDFLNNPNAEVRIQSAKFLSGIGDTQCVEALMNAMSDQRWEVRATSAQSLGLIADTNAITTLSKGLTDPQWWVRRNCAHALSLMGESGHAELIKNLNNKDKFAKEISLFTLQEQQIMSPSTGGL